MDTKKDIKSLNLEELKTELESMGEKAFRAKQMYEWMHVKLVRSFDEMTNLSAKFREQCKEKYEYTCVNPVRIQESKIDGTKKFLFELSDGNVVESVWMQYKHGNSVCISSQVGCRMGCKFCASTLDGLDALLATVQMPKGIPVATVAIDGAANAAILAAQMLALSDPEIDAKLEQMKADMEQGVKAKDAKISAEYSNC